MNKTFRSALGCAAGLALAAGASRADYLQITSWYLGGAGATVAVYNGPTLLEAGTFGVGSFRASLNGNSLSNPIYCLDLFHSFSFGQNWNVNPIVVPPDPPSPPPWNTGEASWVYNRYGISASNANQAGGVQIALWEISHDQGWRTGYSTSYAWWNNGNFRYNQFGSPIGIYADQILDDVFLHYDASHAGHTVYYQPDPLTPGATYGQGQIGAIPEPATILILALGLAGLRARFARKRR